MYEYKMLLAWIGDISTSPRSGRRWPIIDVDDNLLSDYLDLFSVASEWGYDGMTIWGLHVSHSWPVEIESCLDAGRHRFLERMLEAAHSKGLRILAGLGLYSWGFEEIIKAYPDTAKDEGRVAWGTTCDSNGVAMCYHSETARKWMARIIDFVFSSTCVDGVGFQPADMGRCNCKSCRELTDGEYYALLIGEWSEYIRRNWPGKLVAVSGWGMSFGDDADVDSLARGSTKLDFLTDVKSQAMACGESFFKGVVKSLGCAFGSLGDTVFTPPQRWQRNRWFTPHARLTGSHISKFYDWGGRAFEFFAGPLANPQYALMTRFVGYQLNHPSSCISNTLEIVVGDTFNPKSPSALCSIVAVLLEIEKAFFDSAQPTHGEFDYEPLISETPGPPIYLEKLARSYLSEYREILMRSAEKLDDLSRECYRPMVPNLVAQCLRNSISDIHLYMKG